MYNPMAKNSAHAKGLINSVLVTLLFSHCIVFDTLGVRF